MTNAKIMRFRDGGRTFRRQRLLNALQSHRRSLARNSICIVAASRGAVAQIFKTALRLRADDGQSRRDAASDLRRATSSSWQGCAANRAKVS